MEITLKSCRAVKPPSPEEEWARAVMSDVLDARVEQYDDNSEPSMFDLLINSRGGGTAAAEVTVAADQAAVELSRILGKREPPRWVDPRLVGGWSVGVFPHARAKRLFVELPELLGTLEVAGLQSLVVEEERSELAPHPAVSSAIELGISDFSQSPTTSYPGSIYVTLELGHERTAGFVAPTGDAIADWVGPFVAGLGDVRSKLAKSGIQRRHAFVWVPSLTTAPFSVIEPLMRGAAVPLPTVAPSLPDEVTDVWVSSMWTDSWGLQWTPDEGWSRFSAARSLPVAAV